MAILQSRAAWRGQAFEDRGADRRIGQFERIYRRVPPPVALVQAAAMMAADGAAMLCTNPPHFPYPTRPAE